MKHGTLRLWAETRPPRRHARNSLRTLSRWCTWSSEARRFLADFGGSLRRCRVRRIEVNGCEPYQLTLHSNPAALGDDRCRGILRRFAAGLVETPLGEEAVLLRGLLEPPVDTSLFRAFLALLRATLIELTNDERAAMYSPPQVERKQNNEFLLHADLFLPGRLLLVFDDVPKDGSGASLLLPKSALIAGLDTVRTVPRDVHREITALLDGEIQVDSFDRLFDLLHGDHAWRNPLNAALAVAVRRICFDRGEGYLIDDRSWLHGRETVTGRVGSLRFHRLVFG